MDSFELLYDSAFEAFVKCRVCGTLWVIRAAMGSCRMNVAVI
jgi:hypothetical protein